MRFLTIFLLTCCICAAQSVTLGVIGGGRVTDDVSQGATSASRIYDIGPSIEVGLPLGLSFEFDAIYHRQGYGFNFGNSLYSVVESERANSWEFPLLLKYKLPVPVLKPFVEVGVAPRRISGNIFATGESANIPQGGVTPFSRNMTTNWSPDYGVVAGGGVQIGIGRLRLSPQVRYTYRHSTPVVVVLSDGPTFYSSQNQVDVLLGIGWKFH